MAVLPCKLLLLLISLLHTGARKRTKVAKPSARCPKAISLYAMPKTGSTFLGRFSRDVALRQQMCKVYQNTKEFVCESVIYVDCPRNELHEKSVHLERAFSRPTHELPETATADHTFRAWDCGPPEKIDKQWRCKLALPGGARTGVANRRRCDDGLRHQMFRGANQWLREGNTTGPYRYNLSVNTLLSARGFVRGPLRQLYTEFDARAVPSYANFHNVIIVHTR